MKFTTLNDLVEAANRLPRTNSDKPRPITTKAFRHGYVEFCRHNDVVVSFFAADIGVAPTTPYTWAEEYDAYENTASTLIQETEAEIDDLEARLEELNNTLAMLEKLQGMGYKVIKG